MVEIIPKPIAKKPPWSKILFSFSVFLFIILIPIYFNLISLQRKLEEPLFNLEEALSKGKTPEIISLEEETLNFQRRIRDFSPVLKEHVFCSKFFEFFEKNTHPRALFSQINLNSKDSKVELLGKTDSFFTLGQQLLIFEKTPEIENLNLTQVSISREGKIEFMLEFSFDPKILKY